MKKKSQPKRLHFRSRHPLAKQQGLHVATVLLKLTDKAELKFESVREKHVL